MSCYIHSGTHFVCTNRRGPYLHIIQAAMSSLENANNAECETIENSFNAKATFVGYPLLE
jgi:hypothetical protein